jgi:molecular chaperone HtpG
VSAYRSHREDRPAAAPTAGLVADMVRQFADPYAFLRELVQNGIDAGATSIEIAVERWPGDRTLTRVTDDGSGMTPAILEGQLLTLFSSTKEGDLDKIGKYGVGFVSVLALGPEEVMVETSRGGEAWLVKLAVDHRYVIEEAAPRAASGTAVTLVERRPFEAFEPHVARVRAALRRWCRHAERPIRLVVADRERGTPPVEERLDAPVAVPGPLAVSATIDGDTIVVGPSPGALQAAAWEAMADDVERMEWTDEFAGFYNRGLTLLETTTERFAGLGGLRFKVVSPRLQHTLSRDDVRRDDAFARCLDRVRTVARGPLRRALGEALARAARAECTPENAATYAALLEAALAPPMELDARTIPFPLTDPVQGATAITDLAARGVPLLSQSPDAVTAALAAAGRPVVRCADPAIASLVRRCFPRTIVEEAQSAFVLARELAPAEIGPADAALAAEVARAVAAAGESVGRVSFCTLEGASPGRTAVVVPDAPRGTPGLASPREIEAWWRRFGDRHRLLLDARSDAVQAARALATRDPRTAGQLLARALLVEDRWPLDKSENIRLLALAGGEPR